MKLRLPSPATLGPLVALVLACAFFGMRSDRFLTGDNLSIVLQQVMVVGVIAVGQTLIILTAGVDLSCGMVMALGGIVMTTLAVEHGVPVPIAIGCGIGATTAFGLINGLLVTRLKLPPFIVTLGTLNIAFAITQLYSDAQTVTDDRAGPHVSGRQYCGRPWSRRHAAPLCGRDVRADPDCVWSPRVRGERQH